MSIPITKHADRAELEIEATAKDFLLHDAQAVSGDYMLFYVPAKTSYCRTTERQIRKLMHLPKVPQNDPNNGTDYWDRLLSIMTGDDLGRFHKHIDGYLDVLVEDPDRAKRWNSCVRLCFDHLYALLPRLGVLSEYNEATRRLIVNEIMQAAAMFCNTTLGVEEIVWKRSDSVKFENVCGYGPLDYSTATSPESALAWFTDTNGVLYDTAEEDGSAETTVNGTSAFALNKAPRDGKLPCTPVRCSYAKLPSYKPTPYGRTAASPPSESANGITTSSSSSSSSSSSCVSSLGARLSFVKETPLTPSEYIAVEKRKQDMAVGSDDEDKIDGEYDEEGSDVDTEDDYGSMHQVTSGAFSINTNAELLSQSLEEKKLFKTLSEAKRWSVVMKLLKSLWQTLGELHDLHLDPKTKVASSAVSSGGGSSRSSARADPPNSKSPQVARVAHGTVYGTLTSGQTYHFFRSDWPVAADKPTVTYLGRLTLSVLIYDKVDKSNGGPTKTRKQNDGTAVASCATPVSPKSDDPRLSGVSKDDGCDEYNRVSYEQFQRVVAATVMTMEGSLRGAKELEE